MDELVLQHKPQTLVVQCSIRKFPSGGSVKTLKLMQFELLNNLDLYMFASLEELYISNIAGSSVIKVSRNVVKTIRFLQSSCSLDLSGVAISYLVIADCAWSNVIVDKRTRFSGSREQLKLLKVVGEMS